MAEPCGAGTGPTTGRASGRPFPGEPCKFSISTSSPHSASLTSTIARPRSRALSVRVAVRRSRPTAQADHDGGPAVTDRLTGMARVPFLERVLRAHGANFNPNLLYSADFFFRD